MKKLPIFALCSTVMTFCLGAVTAQADFVSPRVPPRAVAKLAVSATDFHVPPSVAVRFVINTRDDGPGSLRRALATAGAGDKVRFLLPLPATISLSSTLVITQDVVILGPGPDKLTVMRRAATNAPAFRVFKIDAGTVTLSGITIKNGIALDDSPYIDNLGGGIYSQAALTVSNCVVTGNSALSSGSGTNSSLGFGGGIFSVGSPLTLINSTFSGNAASAAGGGVCTFETMPFLARGCTISDNYAAMQGGGLNFQGHVGTVQNCTISGNATAADGAGSALVEYADLAEGAPTLTLTACTVAGNTGTMNGAIAIAPFNDGFGMTNRMLSTLVGPNAGPNFAFYGPFTFLDLGNNLDTDGSSGLVNGVNGDQVGTSASPIDPKLGPLQNNGGPTETMALLVASPALGGGSCHDAEGAPLGVDQRGFPRPATTGCDIGAYENEPLTLMCPPDVVAEFQNEDGAVVKFKATVIDPCPHVATVYSPPSGSVFPIGVTTVQVQATDSCSSNTATCSFTVTVLGAQGVKSNVLAELEVLRAGATNPKDRKMLDEVIADVSDSLAPALWVDQIHLDPADGGMVFLDEQAAVDGLIEIINYRQSRIPDAALQDLINQLVKCDRALAMVSIQDAVAGGANLNKIKQALQQVEVGDKQAAHGKPVQAIQHYLAAWSKVTNL
jgi:hypothetical protein